MHKLIIAILTILAFAFASFAAQWDVIVSRSRDAQSVDISTVQSNGQDVYIFTTNYAYTVSAQIPRRPNGVFVDWQKEWVFTDLGQRRPGWNAITNRVATWALRFLDNKGVATNTATLNIYKGKQETQ